MTFINSKLCDFFYGVLVAWLLLQKLCLARIQIFRYGQPCDYLMNKCDQSKHLVCFDRICNCSSPETMIYDETAETCAVTKGHPCHQDEIYTETLVTFRSDLILASRAVKITRKLPCADGTVCTELTCQDIKDPEFEYNVNNKLSLIPCNYKANKHCPSNTGLNCINGYCKCGLGSQQYYNGTKCVSLVNGDCTISTDYTADTNTTDNNRLDCLKNANCVQNGAQSTCQCETGFVSGKNGRCVPDYQQPCDDKEPFCGEERSLACVNGKCECETERHVYDAELKRCRGLVGSSCQFSKEWTREDEWATPILCVSNAFCDILYQTKEATRSGICKCGKGYLKTANRTCVEGSSDGNLVDEGNF